jgi:hypothetical protein
MRWGTAKRWNPNTFFSNVFTVIATVWVLWVMGYVAVVFATGY